MRVLICFQIPKLFLFLILASFLYYAFNDGVGASQSIGQEELLVIKLACLGYILKEACEVAFLGVLSVYHGADVGKLDVKLMRLAHLIEFLQDIYLR